MTPAKRCFKPPGSAPAVQSFLSALPGLQPRNAAHHFNNCVSAVRAVRVFMAVRVVETAPVLEIARRKDTLRPTVPRVCQTAKSKNSLGSYEGGQQDSIPYPVRLDHLHLDLERAMSGIVRSLGQVARTAHGRRSVSSCIMSKRSMRSFPRTTKYE